MRRREVPAGRVDRHRAVSVDTGCPAGRFPAGRVDLDQFRGRPGATKPGGFVLPGLGHPWAARAVRPNASGIRDIENSDHRDIMSLAGLLTILDDDPQLHEVVSRAESDTIPRVEPSAATLPFH